MQMQMQQMGSVGMQGQARALRDSKRSSQEAHWRRAKE